MADKSNIHRVWEEFFAERVEKLPTRFTGTYRAVVVETNDPLQLHRIRFKCPELHDWNLKPEECPWAIPAPHLGGSDTGSWVSPLIDDIIFITFEKNHPYGPIYSGFASGTRRKRYPLESIFTESPQSVDAMGKPLDKPSDYQTDYLPKDRRPMSHGWRDRYGNSEISCSVGFFPKEHEGETAPAGTDAISKEKFEGGKKPEINKPDRKYLAKLSKYGIFVVQSDVGYYWKKDKDDKDLGEFDGIGDAEKEGGKDERKWEIQRYFFFQQLLNESKPNSEDRDQRRYEIRTRAGHKFEMRDVGWAQKNGGMSVNKKIENVKSRIELEGDQKYGGKILSKWEQTDERWLKWRTKGGHLIQLMDTGFHPEKDDFYKRKLLEETGPDVDHEKSSNWTGRDSRQIRILTRWGVKFVLDDRGSHAAKADTKESPRANGWMLKSRRSWQADPGDSPRGFAIECNDKNELNTTRWYTPKSKIIEMNDRKDYAIFCTDTASEISESWKGLDENEFAVKIAMTEDPEKNTYHLKLDKHNGYLRLKTAAGGDNGLRTFEEDKTKDDPEFPENQKQEATEPIMKDANTGENQGLECRDGRVGDDGAWTEIVDIEDRGFWFSKQYKLGIWRARKDVDMYIGLRDDDPEDPENPNPEETGRQIIIIRNATGRGPIQIFCAENVEIIGNNIALKASNTITMKAGTAINFEAGGAHAQLVPGAWNMDVPDNAPKHTGFLPFAFPGAGAQSPTGGSCAVIDPAEIIEEKREPVDRSKVDNEPFSAVPEGVVKGE